VSEGWPADPAYRLWLPGVVTPTLNVSLRQHWSRRRQGVRDLAWAVRAALGRHGVPAQPFERALVCIERRTAGTQPDHDGLVGGAKGLIDTLLPMDAVRRPYGLGFIRDDSPAHLELIVRSRRVAARADQGMLLTITPLP